MATKAQAGSKTVLVPIANGSEEIEAVTIIDTLRRAGAEVTVASVEDSLQVWLLYELLCHHRHVHACKRLPGAFFKICHTSATL